MQETFKDARKPCFCLMHRFALDVPMHGNVAAAQ